MTDSAATVPLRGTFATIGEALDAAAEQFGEREAYRENGHALSFREWIRAAAGIAAHMRTLGVARGDVVAVMLPASIDYVLCYAAIVRLGAVATGINTRLGAVEVTQILATCTPRLLVLDDNVPTPSTAATILRRSQLHALAASGAFISTQPSAPHDPVAIIWTSGTTGKPKGAWFDHENLAAAVPLAGCMAAPFDRRLVSTPFAHAGYMAKLWEQVAYGITMVISPPPWSAAAMARSMVEDRITVAGAVPTQWAKLLEEPGIDALELSHLRLGITATAPISAQLAAAVARTLHRPLIVRYSMTECPTMTGTNPQDPAEDAAGSVGRPLPGVLIRICDAEDSVLPAGTIGHIQVRAACVMRGYWTAPDATAASITTDGWLRSGDLGAFDANGYLRLAGRSSEMYIRGGYNVYPQEVEAHLVRHPAVRQACVVGLEAPIIGEIGVAFVIPTDLAQPPTLADLRQWCDGAIADYKRPDRVEIVDQLPLTAMMKVDRRALLKRLNS